MLGLDVTQVIQVVAGASGLAAGVVVGLGKIKEHKAIKRGHLKPNPKRCEDHEQRLRAIEADVITVRTDTKHIQDDVTYIRDRVDKMAG